MTKKKDRKKFIKQFKGTFKKIIAVNIDEETDSLSNKILFKILKKNNYKAEIATSLNDAFKKVSSKRKKIVCIFGSLYLCGKVLKMN